MTASNHTAIVVGAFAGELAHVQHCLPGWRCLISPMDETGISESMIPGWADLAIVYAQVRKADTLAICNQLRHAPETSSMPILLVVHRHSVVQGNAVKLFGNAAFIMPPFSGQAIRDRITQCLDIPQQTIGKSETTVSSCGLSYLE